MWELVFRFGKLNELLIFILNPKKMSDFCDPQTTHPIGGNISDNDTRLQETVSKFSTAFKSQLGFPNEDHTFFYDFGTAIISEMLKEPDCVGIRVYPGLDENNKLTMSVVGLVVEAESGLRTSNLTQVFKIAEFRKGGKVVCACCPRNG
ncbi:MAG: hypothetical protein U5N85_11190 [Arcicella sp.]|nr:hypothetical protein [Arcicella sp.]